MLPGCAEDVTAVLDTERAFTLYGVLTPQADTQRVLVFPIEHNLLPRAPEPLAAHFASTDLTTGHSVAWRDSLTQDASGQYEHIFWAPFRAEYDHTYRLDVTRSDGAAVRVEATVPPETHVVLESPSLTPFVMAPVRVTGGAPRLLKIQVTYTVDFKLASTGTPPDPHVTLSYDALLQQTPGGWLIPINLGADFLTLRAFLQRRVLLDASYGLLLVGIAIDFIVASEPWNPPGGAFDPNVLVEPGTMSNVENGFGFVGAGYRVHHRWLPPPEVARAAGFRALDP